MQQLKLFSSNMSRSLQGRTKRHRKNGRIQTPLQPATRWDLWTQETEAEKEMALFFLDIRNFTPLVEQHLASNVIHIVKKIFYTFQNIIRIHHGRIIETSGDGFYAAFGFHQNVKDAANDAVQAGMTILQTLENMNAQSLEKNLRQRIDVGIGVHVGKVATGNLHLGNEDHFVIMGYPVNIASRLQSVTKELNNNFIVSSAVFKVLNYPLPDSTAVEVNLKGVAGPCELHLIGKSYAS